MSSLPAQRRHPKFALQCINLVCQPHGPNKHRSPAAMSTRSDHTYSTTSLNLYAPTLIPPQRQVWFALTFYSACGTFAPRCAEKTGKLNVPGTLSTSTKSVRRNATTLRSSPTGFGGQSWIASCTGCRAPRYNHIATALPIEVR